MKIKLTPSNLADPSIVQSVKIQNAFEMVIQSQLTVGLVAVAIAPAPPANFGYNYVLANRSTAAQNIRIGSAAVVFAPATGILLAVGDVLILDGLNTPLFAIADAVGALLDRWVSG